MKKLLTALLLILSLSTQAMEDSFLFSKVHEDLERINNSQKLSNSPTNTEATSSTQATSRSSARNRVTARLVIPRSNRRIQIIRQPKRLFVPQETTINRDVTDELLTEARQDSTLAQQTNHTEATDSLYNLTSVTNPGLAKEGTFIKQFLTRIGHPDLLSNLSRFKQKINESGERLEAMMRETREIEAPFEKNSNKGNLNSTDNKVLTRTPRSGVDRKAIAARIKARKAAENNSVQQSAKSAIFVRAPQPEQAMNITVLTPQPQRAVLISALQPQVDLQNQNPINVAEPVGLEDIRTLFRQQKNNEPVGLEDIHNLFREDEQDAFRLHLEHVLQQQLERQRQRAARIQRMAQVLNPVLERQRNNIQPQPQPQPPVVIPVVQPEPAPVVVPEPVVVPQPVIPEPSIFTNYKWQLLTGAGVLGGAALVVGHKFFGAQAKQIEKLKAVIKDMHNEKYISLDATSLTRLTKENQTTLQKNVDAFNHALKAKNTKISFQRLPERIRNRGSVKSAQRALERVLNKCIEQIKSEPVRSAGILSAAADKFGAFCAAAKYYAWDKWTSKKTQAV